MAEDLQVTLAVARFNGGEVVILTDYNKGPGVALENLLRQAVLSLS